MSDCEFNIYFSYNASLCDGDPLVFEICKKVKESDLTTYSWKAHRPFVERRNNVKFTLASLKKRLLILFQLFSEKSGLKNYDFNNFFVKKELWFCIFYSFLNDWAVLCVVVCTVHLTVCYYHVTHAFQSESTPYSCLNVKETLARKKEKIWSF